MPATKTITARQLQVGDVLWPTNRTVQRVVLNGLYRRTPSDTMQRGVPFPTTHVEVILDDDKGVRYFWKTTRLSILDAGN